MAGLGAIRTRLLGFPPEWLLPDTRGFERAPRDREQELAVPGRAFRAGYHLALERPDARELVPVLRELSAAEQGFAFEGAAMAYAILDWLFPWRRHWRDLVETDSERNVYVCLVGMGWASARLRLSFMRSLHPIDGSLRWLVGDGIGFHEGYFHFRRYQTGGGRYRRLSGYARRSFDQGFGRSLWFVCGARPESIAFEIGALAPERQADLWSGIGLAAAYAGAVSAEDLQKLRELATSRRAALAQGAAFGVEARQRAGIGMPCGALACRELIGCEPAKVVAVVRSRRPDEANDRNGTAYERWRREIQLEFS